MAIAVLLPNGKQQFLDANGTPLAGGSVFFYIPNTTTFKNTWQDAGETTLNTNPVILDSAGTAIIYGFGQYRQLVKDSLGNTIWDQLTSSPPMIGPQATLSSATTTDLGSTNVNVISITGTTTINSFGSSANTSVPLYFLTFAGSLTLTHNATSLILPGLANIVTAAGDTAIAQYLGSGNWQVVGYTPAVARVGGPVLHLLEFAATTTWNTPAGTTTATVFEWTSIGGGGGGAGGAASGGSGSGGGAGATAVGTISGLTAGTQMDITVGPGGAGGAAGANGGASGNTSSVAIHSGATVASAGGGAGGNASASAAAPTGAAGGNASVGNVSMWSGGDGQAGGRGLDSASTILLLPTAGAGGASSAGGGGAGGAAGNQGITARAPGGGGGGGAGTGAGTAAGGDGANGRVRVHYVA